MNFHAATGSYEKWLGGELTIVGQDLAVKHERMREAIFPFLRATFYRWAQIWPEVCAAANNAPAVLAVGDLHIENFGTWRDTEGRLVWGINDFDEGATMPYTIDLVRLAASAHVAINAGNLELDHKDACSAILAGYSEGLAAGGMPWILGEKHEWLRELVSLNDPVAFWAKLNALNEFTGQVPKDARRAIEKTMPRERVRFRVAHRVAGLGSLGRQRFVAIADYGGAHLCREAKALAPSAWVWASAGCRERRIRYQQVLDTSVRSVDPFVRMKNGWIVRRLAPDCTRIELSSVPKQKEKARLLRAMGWETANVHLGSKQTAAILRDLRGRPEAWLHQAAEEMVKATTADWTEWRGKVRATSEGAVKKAKARKKVK